MDAVKINDNTIQIIKQQEAPAPTITNYDYDFLVAQKARIIADANAYLSARKTELDEVNALLAECDKLRIKAKEIPAPIEE